MSLMLLNEVTRSEEEVVTVRVWPGSIVGILEPAVRRRRLAGGRGSGERWKRRRSREGWPDFLKAESEGAKTVAEGDCSRRVSATISSVSAMETYPESERTSEASKMASRGRARPKEKRPKGRRRRRSGSEDAIDEALEIWRDLNVAFLYWMLRASSYRDRYSCPLKMTENAPFSN